MATVTGLTASRMLAIEGSCVVAGDVVGDNLVLKRKDGTTTNAGNVRGPQGVPGTPAPAGVVNPTPNSMPLRSSTGTLKGATPTASDDLTTKAYVDPLIRPTELGTGVDLNTIITPGIYSQTSSVEAQAGTNYPPSAAAAQAGLLEVFVTVATPIMYWQRYMPYLSFTKTMYVRGWYNNAWSVWSAFSADNALDGGWVTIKTVDPILRIRQVGNTIWLYQDGALDTAAGGLVNNGSKVFAGLIPTAMRPSSNVRLSCALDQRPGVVIAGSNGDVTYFNYTGATRTNVNASQSNYILG